MKKILEKQQDLLGLYPLVNDCNQTFFFFSLFGGDFIGNSLPIELGRTKARLQDLLQTDRNLTAAEFREINPRSVRSIEAALKLIGNPVRCCHKILELVSNLVEVIRAKRDDTKTASNNRR